LPHDVSSAGAAAGLGQLAGLQLDSTSGDRASSSHNDVASFIVPNAEAATFEFETQDAIKTRTLTVASALSAPPPGSLSASDSSQGSSAASDVIIDIGGASLDAALEAIAAADGVVLAGPAGVVELSDGAASTSEILRAAFGLTQKRLRVGEDIIKTCALLGGSLAAYAARVLRLEPAELAAAAALLS
jgi:hypothetical protein